MHQALYILTYRILIDVHELTRGTHKGMYNLVSMNINHEQLVTLEIHIKATYTWIKVLCIPTTREKKK